MKGFVWPVRVYYEDTDALGVVYYANYLKYMERARTEWLRSLGFEQDLLREQQGIVFVVHSVQIDYRLPARFNDALEVSASVERSRRVSARIAQEVRRGAELLCSALIEIASLNADTLRPCPMPDTIIERFAGELT